MAMKVYHVGTGKRGRTLIIQARRCVDFLDYETSDYWGECKTTKGWLTAHRYVLLDILKRTKPEVYGDLRFTIVD